MGVKFSPISFENDKPCNFYLHAACVSFIKEQFDQSEPKCKPACFHNSIHQESIHVSKIKFEIIKLYLKLSDNIFLVLKTWW